MNAHQIGAKVVEMFEAGKMQEIQDELYSPEILSVEADGMVSKGRAELDKKYEWWTSTFETLSEQVKGPFPHGEDQFALIFSMKTKHRESGAIDTMDEVAVYKTADGRIAEERFFYLTGAPTE